MRLILAMLLGAVTNALCFALIVAGGSLMLREAGPVAAWCLMLGAVGSIGALDAYQWMTGKTLVGMALNAFQRIRRKV